ncbi:MAG: hypothetical protein V7694_17450 [Rhodococcus sp. (in: high G+C Gram-positive bacteria)]
MVRTVWWALAVTALAVLFMAGIAFVTHDSYSSLLVFALPMAIIGSIAAAFQRSVPRCGCRNELLAQ